MCYRWGSCSIAPKLLKALLDPQFEEKALELVPAWRVVLGLGLGLGHGEGDLEAVAGTVAGAVGKVARPVGLGGEETGVSTRAWGNEGY